MVSIRAFRNTSLIEVSVFSRDRNEAAAIANQLVDTYRGLANSSPLRVVAEVTDRAEPGLCPVRPNPCLNLFVGVSAGSLLGVLSGVLVLFLRSGFKAGGAARSASPG